jgi:hypothetical protein
MESNTVESPARRRALPLAIVVGAIGLAGLAWIGNDIWRRAAAMRPAATPVASVLTAPEGATVEAVVRLRDQSSPTVYSAELLDRIDDANYRATGSVVQLTLTPNTAIVMGPGENVRPGAVIQFKGVADASRGLRVTRIVILTKFVSVAGQ